MLAMKIGSHGKKKEKLPADFIHWRGLDYDLIPKSSMYKSYDYKLVHTYAWLNTNTTMLQIQRFPKQIGKNIWSFKILYEPSKLNGWLKESSTRCVRKSRALKLAVLKTALICIPRSLSHPHAILRKVSFFIFNHAKRKNLPWMNNRKNPRLTVAQAIMGRGTLIWLLRR